MKIYNSNTFPEGLGMLDAEPNYNGTYQQGYDDGYKEIEDQVLEDYIVVEAVLNIPGFSRLVPLINNTNGLKKMLVDGKWVNPKNRYYASTSAGPVNVKYFYSKSDVEKYIIFNEWFKTCIYLESIKIPEYYVDADNSWFMRYIPYRGFEGCRSLKTVVLPSNLIGINSYAFSGCTSLEHIDLLDDLEHIGEYAFSHSGLKDVRFPSNSFMIQNGTCSNCASLTAITFPTVDCIIGDLSFAECASLSSLVIPENISSINSKAFFNCSLEYLTIKGENKNRFQTPFTTTGDIKKWLIETKTVNAPYNPVFTINGEAEYIEADAEIMGWWNKPNVKNLVITSGGIFGVDWMDRTNGYGNVETITIKANTWNNPFGLAYCDRLETVIFEEVDNIPTGFLYECGNLSVVVSMNNTPPALNDIVFEGTVLSSIYVPDEAVDAYKSAWSEWASLIKPMSER